MYKSFCLSRLLYGLEIFSVNKKTQSLLNISQNNLIRFLTGLSRNSHISNTRKILRILSIEELFKYMKLIFAKNLLSNKLCYDIFKLLLTTNYKDNSTSFIKNFKDICNELELEVKYVIKNINNVIKDYKQVCLIDEDNTETELISLCLKNNHDYSMIHQFIYETSYYFFDVL